MSERWSALNGAGNAVALLAGLQANTATPHTRGFPEAVRKLGDWRLDLAQRGIQDLAAFMEPGLAALLAVNERGQDASAPALALWREFTAARAALLELVP